MLRIVTFKWGSRYTMDHVDRLRSMLARHLTIPWEFVLISDDPEEGYYADRDGYRHVDLWGNLRHLTGCGVRLHAFHPSMGELIGPRFAWIDMDVVVTGNVDHIFSRPEPFVALKTPRPPLPFNGSLVMMDAGARACVLSEWSMHAYEGSSIAWRAVGGVPGGPSDEKWMGSVLGGEGSRRIYHPEATVGGEPGADGIYYYRRHLEEAPGYSPAVLPTDARLVIFNGAHKPWHADVRRASPWVLDHYR